MSYQPTTAGQVQPQAPKKDNRGLIYSLLIIALVITWGYIAFDKSKTTKTVQTLQSQVNTVDSNRSAIQQEFNVASAKLDSMNGSNIKLQGTLADKNNDIQKLKYNIASILKNKNATTAELTEAKKMIDELNGKVEGLYADIEKLKGENQQLVTDKVQLTTEKEQLVVEKTGLQENLQQTEAAKKNVEDVASTLHASAISVAAIDIRYNGKEKETTTAKRADLLRVSFQLDENRIAPSGSKDLYVRVLAPDGTAISNGDIVTTREEGDKQYTTKVTVNYEQGKVQPVSFDWKGTNYQPGDYMVVIYQNGYKIGEGMAHLKKGGLFS